MLKQKRTQSGCKKLVSSKIEVTKSNEKGLGLIQYRLSITSMSKKIKEYAVKLSPNLLKVKIGLMKAVREVVEMMKKRRD